MDVFDQLRVAADHTSMAYRGAWQLHGGLELWKAISPHFSDGAYGQEGWYLQRWFYAWSMALGHALLDEHKGGSGIVRALRTFRKISPQVTTDLILEHWERRGVLGTASVADAETALAQVSDRLDGPPTRRHINDLVERLLTAHEVIIQARHRNVGHRSLDSLKDPIPLSSLEDLADDVLDTARPWNFLLDHASLSSGQVEFAHGELASALAVFDWDDFADAAYDSTGWLELDADGPPWGHVVARYDPSTGDEDS